MSRIKTYFTHAGNKRPFMVYVYDFRVSVYGQLNAKYFNKPSLRLIFDKIFIGESPICQMTKLYKTFGSKFSGNSILIQVDDDYIFIGEKIIKFTPVAEIIIFESPVGNNGFPFPYAVDSCLNIYLLIEGVMISGKMPTVHLFIQNFKRDPYDYYYSANITKIHNYEKKLMKNFCNIRKFYLGNNLRGMRYNANPIAYYDKFCKKFDFIIKLTDGSSIKLTRDEYVVIITAFGIATHLKAFKYEVLFDE